MRRGMLLPAFLLIAITPAARAGDPDAAALLEQKGIVRGPSGFTIRSEADATLKMATLRAKADEFNSALQEANAVGVIDARLKVIGGAMSEIDRGVRELHRQMSEFPATNRGRHIFHGNAIQEDAAWRELHAQVLQAERHRDFDLIPERDRLREQYSTLNPKRAADRANAGRDAALAAMRKREAVDETKKSLAELADDAEVKRALTRLGGARLALSPGFVANETRLALFERTSGQKPPIVGLRSIPPAIPAEKVQAPDVNGRAEQLLRAAQQTERNGRIKGAVDSYRDIVKRFPGSKAAKQAAVRIESLKE